MKFCECDYSYYNNKIIDNILICSSCSLPVECEFSYLSDDPNDPYADGVVHMATHMNMDYCVCLKHDHIATDNISSR